MEHSDSKKRQEYSEYYDQLLLDKSASITPAGMLTLANGTAMSSDESDPIKRFLKDLVAQNPQLQIKDDIWQDVFKSNAMDFVDELLKLFMEIELRKQKELEYIQNFENATDVEKKKMMPAIRKKINLDYESEEVNIDGYMQLLKDREKRKDNGEQDVEEAEPSLSSNRIKSVSDALVDDWRKALKKKTNEEKEKLIRQYQKGVGEKLGGICKQDYEDFMNVKQILYAYPELDEIIQMMGRMHENTNEKEDYLLNQYMPILPLYAQPAAEAEEIILGRELNHMLPIETAIMADKDTELLFYRRYASRELQLFANKPKTESAMKSIKKERNKPSLEKGPMIVALDTSPSMHGRPIEIASALLFKILNVAKKQGRNCLLISFAVRAKSLDLSEKRNWGQLKKFLSNGYTGGSDGEEMLVAALDTLKSKSYSMADLLVISDFEFDMPSNRTIEKIRIEQEQGTCFYGLEISKFTDHRYWTNWHRGSDYSYDKLLDKMWNVPT